MTSPTFTCVNCKRVRPVSQRIKGRMVCRDREGCTAALVEWLSTGRFAQGVAARP